MIYLLTLIECLYDKIERWAGRLWTDPPSRPTMACFHCGASYALPFLDTWLCSDCLDEAVG